MTKTNYDIFIPARLDSSRLEQKHLSKINGKPALLHLIERLQNCKKIRNIIVCTTNNPSDNLLVKLLDEQKIKYFRGNEKDILQRFLDSAKKFETDVIIDVEGDKIYTDPFYVDEIVKNFSQNENLDFIIGNDSEKKFNPTNHVVHGFVPAGIHVRALEKICKIKKTNDTETGYREFFLTPGMFKSQYILLNNIKFPQRVRLTLDYKEDLELAERIFGELGTNFNIHQVSKLFIQKPELLEITKELIQIWEENYEKNRAKVNFNASP
tara:strand:- start:1312 stop:2112 length:801 start_codon:yes stop_codon:yes gene_type:complete